MNWIFSARPPSSVWVHREELPSLVYKTFVHRFVNVLEKASWTIGSFLLKKLYCRMLKKKIIFCESQNISYQKLFFILKMFRKFTTLVNSCSPHRDLSKILVLRIWPYQLKSSQPKHVFFLVTPSDPQRGSPKGSPIIFLKGHQSEGGGHQSFWK